MNKIKNIEFLRIIGILAVILLHLFYNLHIFPDISLYNKFFLYTRNGQKGVDLFFILTGFFFIYILKPQQTFWEFFKKKLVRLYPCLIFVTGATFLFSLTGIYKWGLYDNILNLCFLSGTPLTFKHLEIQTGVFWYCSSMIWVLSLYRYLILNYEKRNVNLWIALLVAFSYTFLIQAKGGKINNPNIIFNHIFHIGFLRAIGGIGLGYFIGEWYLKYVDKIKQITLNTYQSLFVSVLEFICLYFIIYNLNFHKLKYHNDIIFILAFIAIVILFLYRKGLFSKILENNIVADMAKYTYSIFITHEALILTLRHGFWELHPAWVYQHPIINLFGTIIAILIVGIMTYHFVEKPSTQYLRKWCK
jgi:peptidoglycan/LPS O-acetylase OafA/YrhL